LMVTGVGFDASLAHPIGLATTSHGGSYLEAAPRSQIQLLKREGKDGSYSSGRGGRSLRKRFIGAKPMTWLARRLL
jgi:hypothetical protein